MPISLSRHHPFRHVTFPYCFHCTITGYNTQFTQLLRPRTSLDYTAYLNNVCFGCRRVVPYSVALLAAHTLLHTILPPISADVCVIKKVQLSSFIRPIFAHTQPHTHMKKCTNIRVSIWESQRIRFYCAMLAKMLKISALPTYNNKRG